jgi:hypothetical protein
MSNLKKFRRLSLQEQQLFLEALFLSYIAKGVLLVFPFSYCRLVLTNPQTDFRQPTLEQLILIRRAIWQTRRLVFWKNQCLVMSIASRLMLQRRRIHSLLSLGVAFDEQKKLTAHAWLTVNEFAIIGNSGNYHELYYF